MKNPLVPLALTFVPLALVLAALFSILGADPQAAQVLGSPGCSCPAPTYLRASSSVTLAGTEDFVELDTDAGLPVTVTLPASPTALAPLEVWLGSQPGLPGGIGTIDPNGQATTGADLTLDQANEGRLLVFVKPTPAGGGYWRVTEL
jgi:hypothetical protein